MELVTLAQTLWRWRRVVAVGLLLAIAAGVRLGSGGVRASGVASASVVIDTPRSALVANAPYGADSLPWRAATLSGLMAVASVKRDMARRAGIPVSQLAVLEADLGTPIVDSSLPKAASDVARVAPEPYTLTSQLDGVLPIVWFKATAPTVDEAARLVRAATAAAKTAVETSNTLRRQAIVIDPGASVRTEEVRSRSKALLAVGVAVLLFAIWCGCVPLIPGLARFWRATGPVPRKAS